MEEAIIPDDDGKGLTLAFEGGDVEFVNPVEYYADWQRKRSIAVNKTLLHFKNPFMAKLVPDSFYEEKAEESWQRIYEEIQKAEVPSSLITLLKFDKKSTQEQLAKKAEFNAMQFAAFLFRAHDEFGFKFSNYITEQLPADVDEAEMPLFVHVTDDGSVRSAGKTSMSEGQLKAAVEYRRVVVAKFLDHGDVWHCFFTVYRSLRGEETWRGGQPHFHYLSDKWGYTRDAALAMFKGDSYPVTSVHIPFHK